MQYIVEYEICALIFLILVTVRFFEVRQFPSQLNKLFGVILICAIADLALDIGGAFTVKYAHVLPVWVNYAVNTPYYSLQLLFPALLMSYVMIMCGLHFRRNRKRLLLLIPAALCQALLLANPWTDWIFYLPVVEGLPIYTRGPLFNILYGGTAFYLAATVIILLRWRSRISGKQFSTIICFILVNVAALLLQYVFPHLLLTGVAISMAILMMFFTMQNPEDMLDLISGAFNYSAMISFLDYRLAEGKLWLIAVDVAGMRRVNSTFGVTVGNEVLAQIGAFFSSPQLRLWPFRMIGTRFLLLADNEADYLNALDQIENRFTAPWQLATLELQLEAEIRYFSEEGMLRTPEDVINLIDMAYHDREVKGLSSRRQISKDILDKARRQLELEAALRRALGSGQGLSLHYQPLLSLEQQRFLSAEALLRLDDMQLGRLSPAEFIPVAEQTGLIFSIDQLVVGQAAAFLHDHDQELRQAGVEYIEVNLSAAALGRNHCQLIHGIVKAAGADPSRLCFEVTETAATAYPEVLAEFMADMISLGYRFALDDFGTGYANIIQVARLPFSTVKLDRTLLTAAQGQLSSLFPDLIHMFSRLGLTTVVEGVETLDQCQLAQRAGGDIIQGYYYSYPLPEEEYLAFLRQDHPI